MKKILLFIILVPSSLYSQTIDGLKFQMGPKLDFFKSETEQVQVITHLDVSAGIFLFKEIDEQWQLNIGLVKHDYSAKFQVNVNDVNTGKEETYFKKYVYPTFSSYQLAILPTYRYMLTQDIAVYGGAGVLFYLSRKLSRSGIDEKTEELVDQDGNAISQLTLTTYNNELGSGNFVIRADMGMLIAIKDYLAIDLSLNGRFSTLEHGSFKLEYEDQTQTNVGEDRIYNKALGVGLNIGLQLQFN